MNNGNNEGTHSMSKECDNVLVDGDDRILLWRHGDAGFLDILRGMSIMSRTTVQLLKQKGWRTEKLQYDEEQMKVVDRG